MSNWTSMSLCRLVERPISGSRPVGGVSTETEGIPSLGGENVTTDGRLIFENLNCVTPSFYESMPKGRLRPLDVLINKDGAQTGKVALYRGEFEHACVNEHLFILRCANGAVDQRFLFYSILFAETQAQIAKRITGSAQPGLNATFVNAVKIGIPPTLKEQQSISLALSELDQAIEQTESLIAKNYQIKAGLMRDMFKRGLDGSGRLRSTTESQPTKFGLIPKHWGIGSLLDIADRVRQPILTGPFGADLGTDDFIAEGVPVLRIGNVQQGRLDLTDLQFVSETKARMLERYKIKEGDLLFARQGATTGRNALANGDVEGSLINYHVIRVALDQSRCAPLFVEAAFAGDIVKRQIERDKGRGTREGINTAQLKALELPLTSVEEQRAIARILKTHITQIEDAQKELGKLRHLKLGLMHDLLTGRVPVPAKD